MDPEKIIQLHEAIYSRNKKYLQLEAVSNGLISTEIRKAA